MQPSDDERLLAGCVPARIFLVTNENPELFHQPHWMLRPAPWHPCHSPLQLRRSALVALVDGGFDETREERVSCHRTALEFRVKLASHEVWVVRELDHFDESLVG